MATDWKDVGKGIQVRRLDTAYCHVRIHYSSDPEKDGEWQSRRSARYGGVDTPKWRREMEIDYTAVQGQPVYPMLTDAHIAMRSLGAVLCHKGEGPASLLEEAAIQ